MCPPTNPPRHFVYGAKSRFQRILRFSAAPFGCALCCQQRTDSNGGASKMFKKTSKIHTEEPAKPEEASKALESVNEHSRYTLPKDRRCHDCFCTILFLVWWVGMAGIALVGLTTGKPERLLYGSDYTGVPCTADQVIIMHAT